MSFDSKQHAVAKTMLHCNGTAFCATGVRVQPEDGGVEEAGAELSIPAQGRRAGMLEVSEIHPTPDHTRPILALTSASSRGSCLRRHSNRWI